jgi:hypothetical protein
MYYFFFSSFYPLIQTEQENFLTQALLQPHKRQLYQGPFSKILLAYAMVSGFGDGLWDGYSFSLSFMYLQISYKLSCYFHSEYSNEGGARKG